MFLYLEHLQNKCELFFVIKCIETSLKLSRNIITIASQKSSFEHNENVSASEPVSTENIDINQNAFREKKTINMTRT